MTCVKIPLDNLTQIGINYATINQFIKAMQSTESLQIGQATESVVPCNEQLAHSTLRNVREKILIQ